MAPAPQDQSNGARAFGSELKPPRRRHRQPRKLTDNPRQAAMTKALLGSEQNSLLITGLDINDAVGMESNTGKGRSEEVARREAPQNRALQARQDSSGEQGRRGPMHGAQPPAGNFVKRT